MITTHFDEGNLMVMVGFGKVFQLIYNYYELNSNSFDVRN